jgi:hypothetical protein
MTENNNSSWRVLVEPTIGKAEDLLEQKRFENYFQSGFKNYLHSIIRKQSGSKQEIVQELREDWEVIFDNLDELFLSQEERRDIFQKLDLYDSQIDVGVIDSKKVFKELWRIIKVIPLRASRDFTLFETNLSKGLNVLGQYNEINRIVSYHLGDEGRVLYLHISSGITLPKRQVARYILGGMRELARIVRDNSDVKRVKGASVNLVRRYADKLEKMGFNISRHGDVAWIGRDKFLEYFLIR